MQVKLEECKDRKLVKLFLKGRLDAASASQFEEALGGYTSHNSPPDVIVDFSEVLYLSSAGLRVILSAHKMLSKKGRHLVCVAFNEEVFEIIKMAGFDRILEIATTMDEGIARLG